MIAKFHSAPGHSMETTLTINIPPAQSARGQRERAKEEKERATRDDKDGKEKVKSSRKPPSRGGPQNPTSGSPKAHASGSGQTDTESLPHAKIDSDAHDMLAMSPIESDDKAELRLGEGSGETDVAPMDVEGGMDQVDHDLVAQKEREEQREREEKMRLEEEDRERLMAEQVMVDLKRTEEEEETRKMAEEAEAERKRVEEMEFQRAEEEKARKIREIEEEEERSKREQEEKAMVEEQERQRKQEEEERLLEAAREREAEEQQVDEQQMAEDGSQQDAEAVDDATPDVEMLDVEEPTPPPVTDDMTVDQELDAQLDQEQLPEVAAPSMPETESRAPAQKSSRRRRPERVTAAATPPVAATPPPQVASSRSKGRQDVQKVPPPQGPPQDYHEPHPMSYAAKPVSYKEKFQRMREKYEKVVSSQSSNQRNLDVLTEKLKRLQAENDLLLDAVLLAEPNGYQQHFPSPPGSPIHTSAPLPSGHSQPPGPDYPYPNLTPHAPAQTRAPSTHSTGFTTPTQTVPRHTIPPPQPIQQSHSSSLGGPVLHSHTTSRSRDNRERRHSRSESRPGNVATTNGVYPPRPGPVPPSQTYPVPPAGIAAHVSGPPGGAYGGPPTPLGGQVSGVPYGSPAHPPGLQSPHVIGEVVSPRGHGRRYSNSQGRERDGGRERERERDGREREWNGDGMSVDHDASYPAYMGRERDRDRRTQHSPTHPHMGMYPPPPHSGGSVGSGLMAPPPAPRERDVHRDRERDRDRERSGMPPPLPAPGVPIGGPPPANSNSNGVHAGYPPNAGRMPYHRNGSSTTLNTAAPPPVSGGSSSNSGSGTPAHLGSPANGVTPGGPMPPPGSGGSTRSRRQSVGQPRGQPLAPPIAHSVSPSPVAGHAADYGVSGPGGADESLGGPSFAHLSVHASPPAPGMSANGDVNGRRREREHHGHHRLRSLGQSDGDMLPLPGVSNPAMMPTASPSEPPMEIDDEDHDRYRRSDRDGRYDSTRDYYNRDSRRHASRNSSISDGYQYRDPAPHGYSALPMHSSTSSRSHHAPLGSAYDHPQPSPPHTHSRRHSPDHPRRRFSPDPTHVAPILSPAGDGYMGLPDEHDDRPLQEDRRGHSRRSSRGSRSRAP